eukprot:563938_1
MSPSNVPSNSPSDAPSQSTNSPSYAPSNYPSNSPSQPSSSPSNAPSQPSNTPSYAPSSHSNPPSISPSNAPSHPSSSPTVAPSQPSQAPSFTPSQPSTNPTVAPSFSPTLYDPEGEVPRTLFLSQNNGCDQGYCGSADPNLSCDQLTSTCQSFDYTWRCFNGYLGCDQAGYDGHGKIQMDIGTYSHSNPLHVHNKQIRIEGAGSQTVFEHNMAPTNAPSASPTNAPTTAPTTAPTSTVIPALDPLVGNLDISGGIGWIKAFECDVTRKSFRYQSPFVDLASFITFSNHAISAKLVPRNASNPADYEVQTVQCGNPIWNLNNGWEMSYTTDSTTGFITGYTDLNDWIGTSAAKERLNNSCVEDDVAIGANPHLLSSGLIYQACGKDEGLHLSQHSSWKWCEYGVGNANGGGIDFYLGFDPELARDCLITSAPSQSPSDFPTSAPSQPSNSPSDVPSNSPTQPSNSPSYAPSLSSMSPSNVPSNSPSDAPSQSTNSPSYAPSNYPSNSPSQPSSSPSNAPSQPSNTPSYAPSSHSNPPSISPSNAPSHPSSSPTVAPSQPSQAPSFTPSQPSTNPTVAPSFSPTLYDPEGDMHQANHPINQLIII